MQKINIAKKEDRVFFHVIGDSIEYMDIDYIIRKHPEMKDEVEKLRFELKMPLIFTK